jgi:hypothetical protein
MRTICTRNFGYYEPGFYRQLANIGQNGNNYFNHCSLTPKRKISLAVIGKKLNYFIVKKVLSQFQGLDAIRGRIEISNEQCNSLLALFQVSGKFKHFPGLVDKLKIATRLIKSNKFILITQLQIKVIRKPKVVYCDGTKTVTLNDGYFLHFKLKKK